MADAPTPHLGSVTPRIDGEDVSEENPLPVSATPAVAGPGAAAAAQRVTLASDDPLYSASKKNFGSVSVATRLCYPTVAGSATLEKTKWPGAYTVALPTVGSGVAGVANLTEGGSTVGGVFAPDPSWGGVVLDFAAVSAADQTMVVEIGKLRADGTMPQKIASVSLKTITTSGTFTANFDPFTGAAQATTTFRLFDLCTITSRSRLGELLQLMGGTEDNTPNSLFLDTTRAPFYYVLVTTLGVTGPVTVCITPQP